MAVVIGGGVRLPPRHLALFEVVINAIRKAAPGAAIAFNTRPDDSVSLGAIDFGMIVDGSVVVNAATPVAEMHDRRPHLWHRASQQDRVRDLAPGREYGSPCADS